MGAIYRNGQYYSGVNGIDDTQVSDKASWSSEKINNTFGCDKTTAGTYTLKCTVDSSGNKTYTWT